MGKLDHSHEPEAIRERLLKEDHTNYLRDFIYGSIDGIVTTFAIIAGVFGAGLSYKTIIILGFANIFADGFSMAASNYLGTKSEKDERERIRQFELIQVQHSPEGEREEIRQIFMRKGFEGETLEHIVDVISRNETEWLKIMLQEEYGIGITNRSPMLSAIATFVAFIFFGMLPLFPFLFDVDHAFFLATIIAGVSFFLVGSVKSLWSLESFAISGFKTFLIGALASLIAYFTGSFLEAIVK
jgi:vacuolar iron transporter family protein